MSDKNSGTSKYSEDEILDETYSTVIGYTVTMTTAADRETRISAKIRRFFDSYDDMSDFFDIEEIEKSIKNLNDLTEQFDEVHIDLRNEIGEDYQKYKGDHRTTLTSLTDWGKRAKKEIKSRKENVLKKESNRLRVEEEFYRSTISRDLASLELEKSTFLEDLERHIGVADGMLQTYSEIHLRIKEKDDDLSIELKDIYADQVKILEDFVLARRHDINSQKLSERGREESRRKVQEHRIDYIRKRV